MISNVTNALLAVFHFKYNINQFYIVAYKKSLRPLKWPENCIEKLRKIASYKISMATIKDC